MSFGRAAAFFASAVTWFALHTLNHTVRVFFLDLVQALPAFASLSSCRSILDKYKTCDTVAAQTFYVLTTCTRVAVRIARGARCFGVRVIEISTAWAGTSSSMG
jgi:hypothetical protein